MLDNPGGSQPGLLIRWSVLLLVLLAVAGFGCAGPALYRRDRRNVNADDTGDYYSYSDVLGGLLDPPLNSSTAAGSAPCSGQVFFRHQVCHRGNLNDWPSAGTEFQVNFTLRLDVHLRYLAANNVTRLRVAVGVVASDGISLGTEAFYNRSLLISGRSRVPGQSTTIHISGHHQPERRLLEWMCVQGHKRLALTIAQEDGSLLQCNKILKSGSSRLNQASFVLVQYHNSGRKLPQGFLDHIGERSQPSLPAVFCGRVPNRVSTRLVLQAQGLDTLHSGPVDIQPIFVDIGQCQGTCSVNAGALKNATGKASDRAILDAYTRLQHDHTPSVSLGCCVPSAFTTFNISLSRTTGGSKPQVQTISMENIQIQDCTCQ